MKKIKVISVIITLAVMALIFFFSSQNAEQSSEVSSGIADKIIDVITMVVGNDKNDSVRDFIHYITRKAAHFTMYFVLGVSAANTLSQFMKKRSINLLFLSVAFCVLYALSDEFHQYFVPGRSAMLTDVLIDGSGAFLGSVLFLNIRKSVVKRRQNGV